MAASNCLPASPSGCVFWRRRQERPRWQAQEVTNQGSGAICHTFSQQSFLESRSALAIVTQPWVSQPCETLFNYLKRKKKCQNQLRKTRIIALRSSISASSPPSPPQIWREKQTMLWLYWWTLWYNYLFMHICISILGKVTHLRRLKEWELIFPTPLSNKATRLDSIISVSKDLHYPTCMGTAHLTILTKAIHSYIWQSLLLDLSITHHQFTFDV